MSCVRLGLGLGHGVRVRPWGRIVLMSCVAYNARQHTAEWRGMRYGWRDDMAHRVAQHGTAWHGMARHGTAWHGMARHGIAQHDTT